MVSCGVVYEARVRNESFVFLQFSQIYARLSCTAANSLKQIKDFCVASVNRDQPSGSRGKWEWLYGWGANVNDNDPVSHDLIYSIHDVHLNLNTRHISVT